MVYIQRSTSIYDDGNDLNQAFNDDEVLGATIVRRSSAPQTPKNEATVAASASVSEKTRISGFILYSFYVCLTARHPEIPRLPGALPIRLWPFYYPSYCRFVRTVIPWEVPKFNPIVFLSPSSCHLHLFSTQTLKAATRPLGEHRPHPPKTRPAVLHNVTVAALSRTRAGECHTSVHYWSVLTTN